jgi:hypothetical protein
MAVWDVNTLAKIGIKKFFVAWWHWCVGACSSI